MINLLDTPGHKASPKTTTRTLTATGLDNNGYLDGGKGVETTRHRLDGCAARLRDTPIVSPINKPEPRYAAVELLDEIQKRS